MNTSTLSSNWKRLQASGKLSLNPSTVSTSKIKETKPNGFAGSKRKRGPQSQSSDPARKAKKSRMLSSQQDTKNTVTSQGGIRKIGSETAEEKKNTESSGSRINEGLAEGVDIGKYVAIDCEMVGIGPNPEFESALARVSMVNYDGEQIYDSYVKTLEEVTDWRTHVSGIQPKHMTHARSLEEVQADVAALIKDRIVVGHAVRKDFDVLFLDHPKKDIRDTARHRPYRDLAGGGSPKLKILAAQLLGLDIQNGEHSSIEDARATMLLFQKDKEAFDQAHMKKWGPPVPAKKINSTDEAAEVSIQKPKKHQSKKKNKKKKR